MGESILGVAVGTGAGRLDLKIKQQNIPLRYTITSHSQLQHTFYL